MTSTSPRVVIADDHVVFRQGLSFILEDAGFTVVATAGDSPNAAATVKEQQPDLALLDYHMPGGSAQSLVRQIRRDSPGTRIVILSMQTSTNKIRELEELGIAAYLSKVVDAATLSSVLSAVVRSTGGGIIRVTPGAIDAPAAEVTLRTGDRELLAHIAAGRSNAWIARRFYVSEATIKRRLAHLYRELGASTRSGAVSRAHHLGLIRDEPEGSEVGPPAE